MNCQRPENRRWPSRVELKINSADAPRGLKSNGKHLDESLVARVELLSQIEAQRGDLRVQPFVKLISKRERAREYPRTPPRWQKSEPDEAVLVRLEPEPKQD